MRGGVSFKIFKDFFLQEGKISYSLVHVEKFSIKKQQGNVALEQFITKHMLAEEPDYHQLVFVGSGQRVTAFTHSGAFVRRTIKRKGKNVVVVGFQQQENDVPLYMPPNIVELGEALEFHRDFVYYQEMDLYEIKGRCVNNLQAKKIAKEIEWVITGEKATPKDRRAKAAQKVNSLKEAKGWRNGDDAESE